ncbi:MAG: DUF1700 domain-containing protein [Candidatus Scatosoma sp.]
MNKREFIAKLRAKLSGLPKQDVEERLIFYSEMIEDRMEEGLTEEEAVSQIGSAEEIAAQIIADIPLAKIAKERIKPKKRLTAWETVLLALGSPVWLSLLIVAFALIVTLYASLWAAVVALWAAFVAPVACSLGGIAGGIVNAVSGNGPAGAAMLGAGIFCAGLAVFVFFGCKAATKGVILLSGKVVLSIKKGFVKKEKVK